MNHHKQIDDSASALKVIATIITACLLLLAVLILKTDPLRQENQEHQVAIEQVKTFAKFIDTRPALAKPQNRSVLTMIRSRVMEHQNAVANQPEVNNSSITPAEFESELTGKIKNQRADPEALKTYLSENAEAASQYLMHELTAENIKRDFQWEQNLQALTLLSADKDLIPVLKNQNLDLLSNQLINARTSTDEVLKHRVDEWFEKYLKAETREDRRQQMISIYNEKIIQSQNQR